MIRLFLLGFILIIGLIATIVSVILFFSFFKWIKRQLNFVQTYAKQQYQRWKIRQSEKQAEERMEKNIPVFLREASKRVTHIDQLSEQLSSKWQHLTNPLVKEAHEMLKDGMTDPGQAQLTRPYFAITLKALEGFIEALVDMKAAKQNADVMHEEEERQAKDTIEVLMNDTYKYRAKLESKKRFDFHVMMEVIKQRFGK